jgi:hypothetical protein
MASSSADTTLHEESNVADSLFEPVLVVSRLAQASLYPVGTKLYVRDNAIYIQPPSLFQSVNRWWSGDSREDLSYLFEPIQRFTQIYKNKAHKRHREILKTIVESAITGLEKVRDTYGAHRIIDHSLAYYQTFLVKCIGSKMTVVPKRSPFHPPMPDSEGVPEMSLEDAPADVSSGKSSDSKKFGKSKDEKEKDRSGKDDRDREKEKERDKSGKERDKKSGIAFTPDVVSGEDGDDESGKPSLAEKLSGIWSFDDIQMLKTMIQEARDSSNEDERQSRLTTLDSFLNSKELDIRRVIEGSHRP